MWLVGARADDLRGRLEGSFGVLTERNFLVFFIGYLASVIGYGMSPVAFTFAVLEKGYGIAGVSGVLAAETVALVALLLVAGVLADRIPRKVSMFISDAARFCSQGALAILLLTGRPPIAIIAGAAAVVGAGEAFLNPALTGLIPQMVSDQRLQQANGLRALALAAGSVLGPAVAGVIVAADGPGWAIAVTSATFLASALCFLSLRIRRSTREAHASAFRELLDGWREFRSRSWMWLVVAHAATFYALSFAPFMVVGAVVTEDHLGGAASWGLFNAMIGVGSILGGLLAIHVRTTRPLVVSNLCMVAYAIPLALIAVPTYAWLVAVGAGIAGVGFAISTTLWETTVQREVPRDVLSRVSAYDWFGSLLFMPIGYAIAGPVAEAIGDHLTLALAAAWAAVSSVAIAAVPSVRNLRAPVARS